MKEEIINILIGVAICSITYFIIGFIKKKYGKTKKNLYTSFFLDTLQMLVITILFGFVCNQFAVTKQIWSSIITNMSLIVVVLGFAAQESIKNLLSGYMMAKSHAFDIGQRVTINGQDITGTVIDITTRHVKLRKANNSVVIVPNTVMNNAIIENSSYTEDGMIANFLDVNVSYDSDIKLAMKILGDVTREHEFFLQSKEPNILCRNLAEDGYNIRATVWTKNISENFKACSDIRLRVKELFDENNIKIPYDRIEIINN